MHGAACRGAGAGECAAVLWFSQIIISVPLIMMTKIAVTF